MKFCDECGSMMKKQDDIWTCSDCGAEELADEADSATMTSTESQQESGAVDVSDIDDADIGPTTTVICPECGNDTARYEMKQIRAADESETRFFTCTECNHKWREDDH